MKTSTCLNIWKSSGDLCEMNHYAFATSFAGATEVEESFGVHSVPFHLCTTVPSYHYTVLFLKLASSNLLKMYRYSFRFVVMSITILTANLLTTALGNYLVTYKNHVKPLTFTLLGMAVTVIIFYPLFAKLEEWVKKLSMKIVKKGKSLAGKYLGLILAFALSLAVLSYFYAKMWYHIDLWKIVIGGRLGNYI